MRPVLPAGMLAGRANELALLDGYLSELTRRGGNAVLIEGEPGIGKTTLVHAALGSLPSGTCQVFWGTGDELGQEIPLSPFLDALGVRRPSANARRTTIAGLLRGEVATDRGADVPAMLAEQLIALTIDETAVQPVVLVIDDLQWSDPASVRLWGRLARTARQVPLLLIGLTRPAPQREDLLALRRVTGDGTRIQLTALAQPAVAELVQRLAGGEPDNELLRLAEGAAGNPLYLTELLAALNRSGGITVTASGVAELAAPATPGSRTAPGSLTAAIADRLDFVSAAARDVLRAAALLGVEFVVSDLATVLGKAVTEVVPSIDEAHATGVLTDSGNGTVLAFRHPLIREALYAELPAAVRSAWHRDAGQALAAAGAAPDRVARQLLHAVGAVQSTEPIDEWMLEWLVTSAPSLIGQAPGVAAELLGQAVAGIPAGTFRHGWLASRLADALYRIGDRAEAERVAQRALGHATDPDLLVDLNWTLAQCRIKWGAEEESFSALTEATRAPGITPKHRARLLTLAARSHLSFGDVAASGVQAKKALAWAEKARDTWATGWALHVLATMAVMRGDLTEALPLYDRAAAVAETDPTLTDLGLLLQVNKAVMLFNLDRCDEALATAEAARHLADQVGTVLRLAQAHGVLGQSLHAMGRWDDALAEVTAVPDELKEAVAACCELSIAADISFHRDQPDTARRYLAAAEEYAQRIGHRIVPTLLFAQSLDQEHAGAPSAALAVFTRAFDANQDDHSEVEDLLGDAVRLALKIGDKATAQTITAQAVKLARGSQIPHQQANALYCQGMVDRDAAALQAAAQRYAAASRPLPQAKALEAAAECLVEADEKDAAKRALEQAVEVYEFLGAEADLTRVNAGFRTYGIRLGPRRKHRRAVSGWDSLTDMELKVAAFVREGLTNPEIAARLMVGRRTVATHVSHILEKLNVTSRTDIARESALRGS